MIMSMSQMFYLSFQFLNKLINKWIKFGYKLVCNQLTITHYVVTNKIIQVCFSRMTYLMKIYHIIFLNNISK
jgi:hypothetical protein